MNRRHIIMLGAVLGAILMAGLLEAGELQLPVGSEVLGNGRLINVSDLKAGDIIQTADGTMLRIKTIGDVQSSEPVSCYGFATNSTALSYVLESGIVVSEKGLPAQPTGNKCGWICLILKYFQLWS